MSTLTEAPAPPVSRRVTMKQAALDALKDAGIRGAFWDGRVLCAPLPRSDGELLRLHIPRSGPLVELARRPGQSSVVGHQFGVEAAFEVYCEVDRRRRGATS